MSDNELLSDPTEIRHVIGSAGNFSLHNVSGDVEIRGVDGDEVRVVASSSGGSSERLPLVVQRSEGGLHIQLENTGFDPSAGRRSKSIDFVVELPRGANVQVNGVSSDIETAGLTAEQTFKTVSGDVQIDCHGGRISLISVSGDVDLRSDQPISADLTTTSGDIEINTPLLSVLNVKSVSGDTLIRAGFASGPAHSVESVSGDLTLQSLNGLTLDVKSGMGMSAAGRRSLVHGDGSAQLSFRSLSGDVAFDSSHAIASKAPAWPAVPAMPAMPAMPPMPTMPPMAPMPASSIDQADSAEDSLEILQALERGEIDVDEATRRLEGATNRG